LTSTESAELARQLIAETVAKQGVEPRTLTVHADRGTSMRSKLVAELLVDLDVAKSHSRPYVSDDNPFSEAQFKTAAEDPTVQRDVPTHSTPFLQRNTLDGDRSPPPIPAATVPIDPADGSYCGRGNASKMTRTVATGNPQI
jgi:transposase InsO family protein